MMATDILTAVLEEYFMYQMYYTISVLPGPVATQLLSGRSVGRLDNELGYLKATLVRALQRGGK
jgi:hypothetical protein